MLRIWVLGVMRLEVDGVEVPSPSSRRARLLLAMLAVEPRPHSREALAARLWPGVLDESARASLRTALARLRAALGPDGSRFLHATREHVGLAASGDVWTDVVELQRLLDEDRMDAALALWNGELLSDLEHDWVHDRRDELRERFGDALVRAAQAAEATGDLATAVRLTRRRTALDPLAEEHQRDLIRRLSRADDRAAALAAYDRLSQRLRDQLGAAPSTATRELVAAVRAGVAGGERTDGGPTATAAGAAAADCSGTLPRTLHSAVVSPSPFVGREAELAWLLERWAQAEAAVVAVAVGGEPGIGKTRLAAELAATVQREGAHVLYGHCDEGLAVPYQPFVEALRPVVGVAGLQRLRDELGHLAPELGRLLPELVGLGEPVRGDAESERLALFDSVAALVEAMTRRQPALIILDDVHWAAAPTLLMWRHLVRSGRPIRALLLCTYRDTELDPDQPLAHLLADLLRDDSVQRVGIDGLDGSAIAALLEAAVGPTDEHGSQLVRDLEAQTAGNPFFIRELLAHVTDSRAGSAADAVAAGLVVPEGLQHVVSQRVARLSPAAGRTLRVAAVAGTTFSFRLLERVLGEGAVVLDALDEAVAAGLLTELQHGEYAFAHALVRQTIEGQLSAARRMRLHRELGEALEALDDESVESLAHHFAQAAPDGQAVKAAAYALAAGHRAAARLGYEEAADHYERGLDALALTAGAPDEQRCRLLLGLGAAHWGTGDLDKARQAYGEAADVAGDLGDAAALAHAALGFCGPHRFEVATAVTRPVATMLQRALAGLGDDDSPLRARLIGRLAAYTEPEDRRQILARQALATARRVADKATLADVLASTHWLVHGPDTVDEAVAMGRELGRVAEDIGDGRLRAMAHRRLIDHLLGIGDIDAVDRELEALMRLAETHHERYVRWVLTVLQANHAHLRGRLDRCEALAREAVAHGFGGHDENASQKLAMQVLCVRREQGRVGELVDAVAGFVTRYPEIVDWRCALAHLHAQLGRTTQAARALDALAHADFSDLLRDASWLPNVVTLSDVAARLGDVPRAQRLYTLLSPYAGRCVVNFALLCQGSAARQLGLLATTLSRYDDAERHFERALEMNARIGSALWIAHTRHDWARMLLLRGRPEDAARARGLLRQAFGAAEELELRALADDARRSLVALRSDASHGDGHLPSATDLH